MNPRVQCAVQMILGAVLVSAALPAQAAQGGAAAASAAPNASSSAAANAAMAAAATEAGAGALKLVTIEGYHDFTSQVLSAKQLRNSSQPAEAVTKTMIDLFGPDAGGTQALSVLPNVYVSGTNNYSATGRQTISIRGVKVGYNSIPGDVETNAIQAEFDGVPLNSLSQGTAWHSVEVPIGALMQGENVIIGPGNPSERWYSSMGGTIDFIPVQPTALSGGKVTLAGGSSSTYDTSAVYNTGEIHGWSTVFGLASGRSDAIRDTQDSLPADTEEGYVKTRKQLASGSVSFGYYFQRNHEWRPNMIPLTPQPLLNSGGLGIGQPYSQQTSGFYSTLPRSVWHKTIEIQNHMLWSHLHLNLSSSLHLSNIVWLRFGKVVHYRSNNFLLPRNPLFAEYGGGVQSSLPSGPLLNYSGATNVEHYIEHSKTFGDRLAFTQDFSSMDTLKYGGYMIFSRAKSDYQGYSDFDGSSLAQPEQTNYNTTNNIYWAAFVQDDFRPIPRLKIVPGFRVVGFVTDFSNLSPQQFCTEYQNSPQVVASCQAGTMNGDFGGGGSITTNSGQTIAFGGFDTTPDSNTDNVRYEPSIGVNYEVLNDLNLFGNFSITRHNPNSGNMDQYPLNLQSLKPAKAETYDFGARFSALHFGGMRDVYASLDFFHIRLSNETITYNKGASPIVYFGYGSAEYKGVDFSLHTTFTRHWSGFANFGYLKDKWLEFQDPSSGTTAYGLPVSNSPEDTLTAGVTYRFWLPVGRMNATLWDQYVGKRYLFDKNAGTPTTLSMPAYDLVNLSLTAKTHLFVGSMPGVKSTNFAVQVLNVANKEYNSTEYVSSGGYFQTAYGGYIIANPGAPRLVYGSVTLKF